MEEEPKRKKGQSWSGSGVVSRKKECVDVEVIVL